MVNFGDPRLPDRFWEKVRIRPDGCWEWIAGMTGGRGYFWWMGRVRPAYSVAYEVLVGPIPAGLEPDHLCKHPECVNPKCLEPVTRRVNNERGNSPTAKNSRKTQCPQKHEYSSENTYITPSGYRQCRACRRARNETRRVAA